MNNNLESDTNKTVRIKPEISFEAGVRLVEELFGFQNVVCLQEFMSYFNQNLFLQARPRSRTATNQEDTPEKFVLKLINSKDSQLFTAHKQQNEILKMLTKQGIPCVCPIENLNGEDIALKKLTFQKRESGVRESGLFVVRLMEFIPGEIVKDARVYTAKICYEIGQMLGRVSHAFEDYEGDRHHFIEKERGYLWALRNAAWVRGFVGALQGPSQRRLMEEILDAFEEKVLKNELKFRQGFIHGDFNHFNIIVRDRASQINGNTNPKSDVNTSETGTNADTSVVGIIDFDDMMYSRVIYDVAIAIMYMMTCTNLERDPIEMAGILLAGFLSKNAFTIIELEALYYCVAARFIQSLTIGLYTYSLDPRNDYVLSTQEKGWEVVTNFWSRRSNEVTDQWRNIVSMYNHH